MRVAGLSVAAWLQALEEGIEQGSRHNEAIDDMTKREQYLETMNKVTRMRNEVSGTAEAA